MPVIWHERLPAIYKYACTFFTRSPAWTVVLRFIFTRRTVLMLMALVLSVGTGVFPAVRRTARGRGVRMVVVPATSQRTMHRKHGGHERCGECVHDSNRGQEVASGRAAGRLPLCSLIPNSRAIFPIVPGETLVAPTRWAPRIPC